MDSKEFDQLYRRHQPKLLNFLKGRFGATLRPDEIEDIVQNVFLKAFKKIDTFDSKKASISTWLYRIAINESVSYLRSAWYRRSTNTISMGDDDYSEPMKAKTDVQEIVERTEFAEKCMGFIDDINPDQGEAITMVYILGFDYITAAKVQSIPIGTLKSRLHRGCKMLALRAEKNGFSAGA